MSARPLPVIEILPGHGRRAAHGAPWVYSNEIRMTPEAKALSPGHVVEVHAAGGSAVGLAFFNPRSLIALRLLAYNTGTEIGQTFFEQRLRSALALRERLFESPHYRLIHAEADGIPGVAIDRLGDHMVVQIGSAGADRLTDSLVAAIEAVLEPRTILLKNDVPSRALEGLECGIVPVKGVMPDRLEIEENGCRFLAAPTGGQKTGWFFDQRDNRAFVAALAAGRRVLDVYCYGGGFGVLALANGAAEAVLVDSSDAALQLATEAAELNGVGERVRARRADAFEELARLGLARERFGIVVCDPPPFVRAKKDLESGAKGYRKLAKLAAPLVEAGGVLALASCSHNIPSDRFAAECWEGIRRAGRDGRLLRSAGAGADHPVHPALPETAYLKTLVYQLD